ncbi:MAG TPA: redox-regulated ATPase YchF [Patescibacteria group bacterium]|nr:redox-regulated ATPase YchF [Patescibacteria group bacterium]
MGLSVGIVGLPNVGKSTLFNALLKKQQAYVANFPFATIEPNVGVVPVPDSRLEFLAETIASENSNNQIPNLKQNLNSNPQLINRDKWPPIVPATVEFLDIAGLIAGASKGEGLGNKFLSHIRETDAICHVVRVFQDPDIIKQGVTDPKSDFETIETELALADLQTIEKQKDPGNTPDKELLKKWSVVNKFRQALSQGKPVRSVELNEEDEKYAKELSLLTQKPILIVLNVSESDLKISKEIEEKYANELGVEVDQIVAISAKVESELSELSDIEQIEYLKELGVEKSGLERLIKKAFATLGLITFLTAGEKEVRAWTIKNGWDAVQASGVIHTDFMQKFIKADVVDFDDFIENNGWKASRENGKVRSEGKDYIMKDGDVVEFKIGL